MSTILDTIRTAAIAAAFLFGFLLLSAPGDLSYINGIGAVLLAIALFGAWRDQ